MSFDELLSQTCTVEAYLGDGAYGPRFGPPRPERCRAEDITEVLHASTGEEIIARTRVFLPATAEVPAGSRVTIGSLTQLAVTVETVHDDTGPHHLEVRLARR